jgi:hypothetical protein
MKKIAIIFLFGLILFVFQSCEEKPPMKLGNNYFLYTIGSWAPVIIDSTNCVIISRQIVAWNYDSIFIIVKQKPFDDIDDSILITHPDARYYEKKKLYEECQIFNYWIIDKRKDFEFYDDEKGRRRRDINVVIGPLTYEEYWAKRAELNVPDSLKLKEAERVSFPSPVHSWFYTWFYNAREREVD